MREFSERVLELVAQIPPGRVLTYGAIADVLDEAGPRQVGKVMARDGGGVPWWRVVRADGSLPDRLVADAVEQYLREGTPLRPNDLRVDLPNAFWTR